MSKPFLGVGWSFPLAVKANDARATELRTADYEESVRQSVWLILGTAKGERPMRPQFGCAIHDHVFSGIEGNTLGRIDHDVEDVPRRRQRVRHGDVDAARLCPGAQAAGVRPP